MKKSKMLFIILFIICCSLLNLKGEKLFILKDVINPNQIAVSGDELFVVWDASVYRYSIDLEKLINSVGKKGNGPGEFNVNHSLDMFLKVVPFNDKLFLYSSNKLSFLNKNGNQLFEKKLSFFAMNIKPIGNNFVIKKFSMKNSKPVHSICLFNRKLELIKTLKSRDYIYKPGIFEPIQAYFDFKVNKSNIFILESKKQAVISVYDKKGKLCNEIPVMYKPVKLLDNHKKLANEYLKNKSWFKRIPEKFKKKIIYPEFLPICKNFEVKENWLVFHTFKKKERKTEFKFISIKDKSEKNLYLPVQDFNLLEYAPYCFDKNNFYYIMDNSDEEWGLFSEKFDI